MSIKGKITKKELHESVIKLIETSAGSNNSGGATKLVHKKNSTTINTTTNTVAINIPEFNKNSDTLMVYKNSVYIEENEDYTISEDGMSIVNPNGNWNESNGEMVFNFVVLKSVPKVQSGDVISSIIKIASTEWVYSDEEGLYYKDIVHNLGTEYINITAMSTDTKDSVELAVNYVNNNTIKVYSDSNENITVYLQSANTTTDLVMNQIDDGVISDSKAWSSKKTNDRFTVNEQKLNSIEKEFTKTENTKYSIVNGVKEFTCEQDGYIDNIHIEGKTLNNIVSMVIKDKSNPDGVVRTRFSNLGDAYNNYQRTQKGEFTLMNHTDKMITFVGTNPDGSWAPESFYIEPYSAKCIILDGSRCLNGVDFQPIHGWSNSDLSIYNSSMYSILEGNHPYIPYFEGIKSTGQGNKIKVLTTDPMVELPLVWKDNTGLDASTGGEWSNSDRASTDFVDISLYNNFVPIGVEGSFTFYCFYKNDKSFLVKNEVDNLTIPEDAKYFRITVIKTKMNFNYFKLFGCNKQDKKQILTTLRSINDSVKDIIYKQSDKYYKIKRCEEVTLNGREDSWTLNNIKENYVAFKFDISNISKTTKFLCDKFKEIDGETISEGIYHWGAGGTLYIRILNSKLTAQTVEAFKTWLASNPITIVYELTTPVIEEVPNFNPRCFDNKTTILLNSGVIQCEANFDITNSTRSELEVLKSKVSDLDDDYIEQFDITCLNGWSIVRDLCQFNNGVVTINLMLKQGVLTIGTVIAQIPKKFAPPKSISFSAFNLNSTSTGVLVITTDGDIIIDVRPMLTDIHWSAFNVSYSIV